MFNRIRKHSTLITAICSFVVGCVTGASGFLDGLNKFPESYSQFKQVYLYDSEFLKGDWSTNAEYLANSHDLGLDVEQAKIVMSMEPETDGSITGEIMSEKICDALPLTWYINFQSEAPSLLNFFVDRKFYITQLHNGETETVAVLKLIDENKKFGAVTFQVIGDKTQMLPDKITFGKNMPAYKNDYKQLQDYCGDSPRKFWSQHLGRGIPKTLKKD
ncbi:hypothetical protein ABEH32_07070 [Pantoea agglomerans]|uniref:hypothetical protein n=1 Tax=Enterobacter agglomerans TaxID=549 RepID=UPI0016547039|nr:hypothetical protein [Pantoea agglomerans]